MFSGSSQTVKLPIAQEKMSRDSLETEEDIGALCTEVGNGMKEQHEPRWKPSEGDAKAIPVQMTFEKHTTALNMPHRYPYKSTTAGILCSLAEGCTWSRLIMNGFQGGLTTCQTQGRLFCIQHFSYCLHSNISSLSNHSEK